MCDLPDNTGPSCDSGIESEDTVVDGAWGSDRANSTSRLKRAKQLIYIANKKQALYPILKRYGLRIERPNQWEDWSISIKCPFPHHKAGKEKTPSFGYNFKKDYFHCFGCSSSGGAVEFLAYKEKTDRLAIAEQIIHDTGGYDLEEELETEDEKIEGLLFNFSVFVGDQIQAYKNKPDKIEIIEKVLWWMDMYILSRAPRKLIKVEDFEAYVQKCKELIIEECEDE